MRGVLGEQFTEANWTSELRHLAEPKFKEWRPADDTTFYAYFTFIDKKGVLTDWLRSRNACDLDGTVRGYSIRYNIEVKATTRHVNEPFYMSDWQWEAMKDTAKQRVVSLTDGEEVMDRFLIFRVCREYKGSQDYCRALEEVCGRRVWVQICEWFMGCLEIEKAKD